MTRTTWKLSLALIACLLLALPVAAKDIARVSVYSGELVFTPEAAVAGFELTVTGPGGYEHTETFDGGGAISWAASAADGGVLADGAYSYELRPVAHAASRGAAATLSNAKARHTALSGTVTVRGGSLVDPDLPEEPLTKDQVILDDLIVDGSLCVGTDCVNNENFGFDTIRLKENNLRIKFEDTSAGTFPSNDWQLTANDSANGGANRFSIDDVTGGKTPFTIEAAAPTNSLYVDDGGRVGLGTSTPVVELHVVNGDSPTLRLEQNGSSGFTPQTWDLAGNETNFFVRDVTNGSKLPFKVFPNAPTNSLTIEGSTGDIGLGTQTPDAKLHVIGTAKFATADDGLAPAEVVEIQTTTDNTARLRFDDGNSWNVGGGAGNTFVIFDPSDAAEFQINGNGDVTITGGLVTTGGGGACTAGDPCDGVFSPDFKIPTIEEHAAFMWENSYLPAVGPTPENGPINVTQKLGGILNELEKAHIYIEQLHGTLNELQQRLEKLESGNTQ